MRSAPPLNPISRVVALRNAALATLGSSGVDVVIRVRPLHAGEPSACVELTPRGGIQVRDASRATVESFAFPRAFAGSTSNASLFDSCVRGSAEAVAKGLSCAVLCYGQTGSGKTHTMLGTAEDPGIILRSGVQLLEMLAGEPEGQLRVSFLEVYNEAVEDLLACGEAPSTAALPTASTSSAEDGAGLPMSQPTPAPSKRPPSAPSSQLRSTGPSVSTLRPGSRRGSTASAAAATPERMYALSGPGATIVTFEEAQTLLEAGGAAPGRVLQVVDAPVGRSGAVALGLTEVIVSERSQLAWLLAKGDSRSSYAATLSNARSNRSHRLFTFSVSTPRRKLQATLTLGDLAGSEDVGRSGAEGATAREACTINKSLLALGRVINALAASAPHIPYRESKLTRLLAEALGGACRTTFVANVSPAASSQAETLATLRYASRASEALNISQLPKGKQDELLIESLARKLQATETALREREAAHSRELTRVYGQLHAVAAERAELSAHVARGRRVLGDLTAAAVGARARLAASGALRCVLLDAHTQHASVLGAHAASALRQRDELASALESAAEDARENAAVGSLYASGAGDRLQDCSAALAAFCSASQEEAAALAAALSAAEAEAAAGRESIRRLATAAAADAARALTEVLEAAAAGAAAAVACAGQGTEASVAKLEELSTTSASALDTTRCALAGIATAATALESGVGAGLASLGARVGAWRSVVSAFNTTLAAELRDAARGVEALQASQAAATTALRSTAATSALAEQEALAAAGEALARDLAAAAQRLVWQSVADARLRAFHNCETLNAAAAQQSARSHGEAGAIAAQLHDALGSIGAREASDAAEADGAAFDAAALQKQLEGRSSDLEGRLQSTNDSLASGDSAARAALTATRVAAMDAARRVEDEAASHAALARSVAAQGRAAADAASTSLDAAAGAAASAAAAATSSLRGMVALSAEAAHAHSDSQAAAAELSHESALALVAALRTAASPPARAPQPPPEPLPSEAAIVEAAAERLRAAPAASGQRVPPAMLLDEWRRVAAGGRAEDPSHAALQREVEQWLAGAALLGGTPRAASGGGGGSAPASFPRALRTTRSIGSLSTLASPRGGMLSPPPVTSGTRTRIASRAAAALTPRNSTTSLASEAAAGAL